MDILKIRGSHLDLYPYMTKPLVDMLCVLWQRYGNEVPHSGRLWGQYEKLFAYYYDLYMESPWEDKKWGEE